MEVEQKIIDQWDYNISTYYKLFGSSEIPEHESFRLAKNMMKSMYEICEYFISSKKRHDHLEILRFSNQIDEYHIDSEKLKTKIFFGFDHKGFYLSNYLNHYHYLIKANDIFWKKFISLQNYGNVDIDNLYKSESKFLKNFRVKTAYNQSLIFQTISSIISSEIEEENDYLSLNIEVRLSKENTFEEIIYKAEKVYNTFYDLNYLLYKIDQRTK